MVRRDVLIVGAGHNALTCAAYLARAGLDVLVLERRDQVGGCAVTESVSLGEDGGGDTFRFSRASYLAGLLRPHIVRELDLMDRYGLRMIGRDPYSYTPSLPGASGEDQGLALWSDAEKTKASISRYSAEDARRFEEYESFLDAAKSAIVPLLDGAPPDLFDSGATLAERWEASKRVLRALRPFSPSRDPRHTLLDVSRLFTCPASTLLDEFFESEVLKTTLCTDAIIGSMVPPSQPGSGYVLLHHVMGEALHYGAGSGHGDEAAPSTSWCYVQGGMGSITRALASAARDHGAEIRVSTPVARIKLQAAAKSGETVASGVVLEDGSEIEADIVCSGCDPHTTFVSLMGDPRDKALAFGIEGYKSFYHRVSKADYSCGAAKINLAVSELPMFACLAGEEGRADRPMFCHKGTVHFEHRMEDLELAWKQASLGILPDQPVIEMTIPSSLDGTIAPPGKHVVQLFVQYVPYRLAMRGKRTSKWWEEEEEVKAAWVQTVLNRVETFCPGFKASILHVDALSPLDLERVFGIHEGNIFHCALSLHQLLHQRPAPGYSAYQMPVKNLFLCGSGAHPGGGVTGAPGYNAAQTILRRKL